ncbi:MAG: hypothetical protein FWF59_05280 [Turicibacter sp.]|nr:hypothetical protein [Turicibacter sp.]
MNIFYEIYKMGNGPTTILFAAMLLFGMVVEKIANYHEKGAGDWQAYFHKSRIQLLTMLAVFAARVVFSLFGYWWAGDGITILVSVNHLGSIRENFVKLGWNTKPLDLILNVLHMKKGGN